MLGVQWIILKFRSVSLNLEKMLNCVFYAINLLILEELHFTDCEECAARI